MNVLVIGSGAREHALCASLAPSPLLDKLYCAPGNAGIAACATCLPVDPLDFDGIVSACRAHNIAFVVVGPEAPLCAGLVDRLTRESILAFGPSAAAARLEGSKAFAKDFCRRHGIPTAAYRVFRDRDAALAYVRNLPLPVVIKADGLAAGKGVVIAETRAAALAAVDGAFAGQFGEAGKTLVVEAFLSGEEASLFAIVDGADVLPLASAQDHKRAGDGDTGPNTGGMGAYSPAPLVTPAVAETVLTRIIKPTAAAMVKEGTPYRGFLYAGLMLTAEGPQLIEYNVRFGDPEAQVVLPRLKSDLLSVLLAACQGMLAHTSLRWADDVALTVVLASKGYPGVFTPNTVIRNLEAAEALPGIAIFHAATRRENGTLYATGGRVLSVTARAKTVAQAQVLAYRAVDMIDWPGGFCRRDIGWRAIERERHATDK